MSHPVLDRLHLGTPSAGPPGVIHWFNVRDDFGAVGDGVTDDSGAIAAAYAACVAQGGGTILFPGPSTYRTTTRLNITTSHVTIEGDGATILFDPANAVTHDRWLAILGTCASAHSVSGAIAIGATSFTAAAVADVSDLVANDWVLLTETDTLLATVYLVDWVQVATVVGAVVTFRSPCRTAFPATHATVQFRRVSSLTSHVAVRNLLITMTTTPATTVVGISLGLGARQLRLDNVDGLGILNGAGVSTYLPADVTITDCAFGANGQSPEFAATVDLVVRGCTFQTVNTTPAYSTALIDFGTAHFAFSQNKLMSSGNIGLQISHGVHDGVISGNLLSWVGDAGIGLGQGLSALGSQRIAYTGNVLDGGKAGAGNTGLSSDTDTASSPTVISTGNVFTGNVVTNFTHPIAVTPSAGDVYFQATNVIVPGTITTADTITALSLNTTGSITTSGGYLVGASATGVAISGAAKSFLTSPTNGKAVLQNAAFTAGIGFDVTTDGTLALADRALTGNGNLKVGGTFGCNAATPQSAAASGGALAAYVAGANGLSSGANMSALHALVVAMRAALVANGIMS